FADTAATAAAPASEAREAVEVSFLGKPKTAPSFVYQEEVEWVLSAATRGGRIVAAAVAIGADYKWTLRAANVDALREKDAADAAERVDDLWSKVHLRSAKRMLKVFQDNGGVYIKLGQHLNALVYLLPFEYTDTFKVLQDQCPATPLPALRILIKEETGRDLDDLFSDFDPTPIGVASLAQVHKGTLRSTNTPVAIKLQHPHLQADAPIDTALCMYVVRAIKRVFPEFELAWLADEMAVSLPQELDFDREALNLNTVRRNFAGDAVFFVPKVNWSTHRILVEEFVEGIKIDDAAALKRHHVDPLDVSEVLSRVFAKMMFWDGFIHCDPHPGNILIRPRVKPWYHVPFLAKWLGLNPYNFELILLDHGLYRSLSPTLRLDFCHLWTSLIRFDEASLKKYAARIFALPGQQGGGDVMARLESIDPSIDPHRLFASMLTGRPWHVISRSQKDADEVGEEVSEQTNATIPIDITANSTGGLISLRAHNEKSTIKHKFSKKSFLSALTKIMAVLPREVLLIIKTNDILRSVDRQLGVAGGDFLSTGREEEEVDEGRREVVGNRMVRRFGWMLYYSSVAIRGERMKEAKDGWAIVDAWVDSMGILVSIAFDKLDSSLFFASIDRLFSVIGPSLAELRIDDSTLTPSPDIFRLPVPPSHLASNPETLFGNLPALLTLLQKHCPNVTRVSLSGDDESAYLGDATITHLTRACPLVQSFVDESNCGLTPFAIETMAKAWPHLTSLDLDTRDLEIDDFHTSVSLFAERLTKLSVTHFVNALDADTFPVFVDTLKRLTRLKVLAVDHSETNHLDGFDADQTLLVLEACPALQGFEYFPTIQAYFDFEDDAVPLPTELRSSTAMSQYSDTSLDTGLLVESWKTYKLSRAHTTTLSRRGSFGSVSMATTRFGKNHHLASLSVFSKEEGDAQDDVTSLAAGMPSPTERGNRVEVYGMWMTGDRLSIRDRALRILGFEGGSDFFVGKQEVFFAVLESVVAVCGEKGVEVSLAWSI
ncbi:hypothetical protein HDU98_003366, partial [Podochytrium sp. JEL0797]